MKTERLKFPIDRLLDELVLDFGEWVPQLEEGTDLDGWSLERIIEIACGIKMEFAELLNELENKSERRTYQKDLIRMTALLVDANRLLEEERGYEDQFKHRSIC